MQITIQYDSQSLTLDNVYRFSLSDYGRTTMTLELSQPLSDETIATLSDIMTNKTEIVVLLGEAQLFSNKIIVRYSYTEYPNVSLMLEISDPPEE